MAPEAIHPQVLSHQCDLTRAQFQLSSMKMTTLSASLPVAAESLPDPPPVVFPMLRNLRMFLWGAFHRVIRHFWAAKELFSHTRFWLFLCSCHRAVATGMKGEAEKSIEGRGGERRPGAEVRRRDQVSSSMSETQGQVEREALKRKCMKVDQEEEREGLAEDWEEGSTDEEDEYNDWDQLEEESECDWVEWESEDDEEDEDEDVDVHQQTGPKASCTEVPISLCSKQPSNQGELEGEGDDEDDDDSDWSDDDDSETSVESVELWESFLHSDDPYNPLSFSSTTHTSPAKTPNNTHTSPAKPLDATHTSSSREERRADEQQEEEKQEDKQHSSRNFKQHKKVRFSDEVSVRPLVVWAFASRAARDGSCWMQMARDRHRFRRRVEEAGRVLGPCLSPQHRRLVWERLHNSAL